MAFWRRKKEDRYITLGLNTPATADAPPAEAAPSLEPPAALTPTAVPVAPTTPALEPAPTGSAPTPTSARDEGLAPSTADASAAAPFARTETPRPVDAQSPAAERPAASVPRAVEPSAKPVAPAAEKPSAPPPRPVPSRSPFSSSVLGLDRSAEELQAEVEALEQTYAARFTRAVAATREALSERIDTVFQGRKVIDAALLDDLEEALIAADIGVPTTLEVLDSVRRAISRKQINDVDALKAAIKNRLLEILRESEKQGVNSEESVPESVTPYVIMVVGVNGVGKTTTIGKLAQRIKAEGNDVLICAADTFRAAASDQLAIWAERTGVPLIQQKHGTDPAAVLFDALKAARARKSDVLIVDTAGRLHNKSNLMAELEKMKRVAGREVEGAPHETLLVVDAVTGQNGLEQARQFLKVAGVTGIVLTKLDGTAKGGIAVAIAKELRLPIRYAGIGEKVDDLVVFDSEQYVNSLFA